TPLRVPPRRRRYRRFLYSGHVFTFNQVEHDPDHHHSIPEKNREIRPFVRPKIRSQREARTWPAGGIPGGFHSLLDLLDVMRVERNTYGGDDLEGGFLHRVPAVQAKVGERLQ